MNKISRTETLYFIPLKSIYQQRYRSIVCLLIEARKNAQLTQQQVADKINRPQSYIAKIEKFERKIDVIDLIELCKTLGIKASYIIQKIEDESQD